MVYGQLETIFYYLKVRVGGEPETIYIVFVIEVPLWLCVHESFVLN